MNENSPDWYKAGVEAAMLAPTAVNQQKFYFSFDGNLLKAKARKGFYTEMDLGIAQYHFDVATGKNNFNI